MVESSPVTPINPRSLWKILNNGNLDRTLKGFFSELKVNVN